VFPFWDIAIAPVIEAAGARRVVEIGALRGETTVQMLDGLGSDVELHVIDPLPQFDPAEHEQRFPGRYFFHRAISHDVLPSLPPVDVALVDGDHNWYTVFHELEMLSATARAAGQPLPVLVLHDVCWPYGRRDLYYEPSRIPEEFRQPHRQAGLDPNFKKLVWEEGGMNATLHNAELSGGRRNGVMTALDDFIEAYDRPVRRLVLPFYFGLAIVVEEERLASAPDLAAVLDHLGTAEGRQELLELSERIRIDAAVREQNWLRTMQGKIDRGAERYLDAVAAAVSDEPDPGDGLRHLRGVLDRVIADGVPGDLAACGVGNDAGAVYLRAYLEAHEVPDRDVWVIDPDVEGLDHVRSGLAGFDLLDERVRFVEGRPPEGWADAEIETLAVLRLGASVGDALADVVVALHPRVAPGGFVIVRGSRDPAFEARVAEARERVGVTTPLERVGGDGVCWRAG
jgi:hypothetical protein